MIYYARNYYVSMTSKNALKCPTDGSNPKKMYVIYYEIITGMTVNRGDILIVDIIANKYKSTEHDCSCMHI